VVEVLLATVRPRALLAGKIIGIGALGLGQLLLVAGAGVGVGVAVGAVEFGSDVLVPITAVVGWFILGYAFYATMFAAAASRVSRQEDLQNVTTPATMLVVVVVSFFGTFYAINSPEATVAQVLAVIPPFSALMSPTLMAAGQAGPGQVLLAVALMVASIAGLVAIAARTYEGAILRMGSKVSWRDAWQRGTS